MPACSALTGWRLTATPTGFIPEQDQGFLIGVVQLPPGSSLERTSAVLDRASRSPARPDGVVDTAAFAGLDGASFSQASNSGTMFMQLSDWSRPARQRELSADDLARTLITGDGRRPRGSARSSSSRRRRFRASAPATASR